VPVSPSTPPPRSPTSSSPLPASIPALWSPTSRTPPHHDLDAVRGELYVAFAENDRSATPEVVERFRGEMERRGIRGVVERVPGTAHGYAMADLAVYDRAASERHFERTLELWGRNLSAQPVGA
jgi:dienelactone hydrolase